MPKSLAIILLSSVFLVETIFPQVDLADLPQLPEILAHFDQHRLESPEISFLDFVSLHYGNADHLHHSKHDHHKLPFSKRAHHTVVLAQFIGAVEVLALPRSSTLLMIIGEVAYTGARAPSVSLSIWQPPKI